MYEMTRRDAISLLCGAAALVITTNARATELKKDELRYPLTESNRVCEREAKARLEHIINRMIEAAEQRPGVKFNQVERNAIFDKIWQSNREIIAQYYVFSD